MKEKFTFLLVVIFIFLAQVCDCRQWPNNIKRCARNETNMDKCLFQSAKAAMTVLAKGNKDLGVRQFDPLRMGNFTISSELKPIVSRFQIFNGVLEGLSKMVIQNITYNQRRHEMVIEGLHKKLKMSGGYDTIGNMYTLNFKSKGKFTFENKNVRAIHMVKLEPGTKKGFMDMDFYFAVRDFGRTRMNFKDTLLPQPARNALSRMVNENWREITEAMMPTMEAAIMEVLGKAISPMFKRFPMTAIFP